MTEILNYIKTSHSFNPDNKDPSTFYVDESIMPSAIHDIIDHVNNNGEDQAAKAFLFKGNASSFYMKMIKDINKLEQIMAEMKKMTDIPDPLSCTIKIIEEL